MQLAALAVGLASVHGEVAKVPVPVLVKSTVPVGAIGAAEPSVTVAVQVVAAFGAIDDGAQVIPVVVAVSRLTVCITWLGWIFTMVTPRESLAEPVAPELSTTRRVVSNLPTPP